MFLRKSSVVLLILAFAFAAFACSKKEPVEPKTFGISGFTNPEDLARGYLKAIEDKDMEGLKSLVITNEDINSMHIKKANKQHWMGYFSHVKRLFLSKNKDVLGRKLTFLSFRSGTEFKLSPDISIFRGAQILAEQDDGKRITLEINFLVRIKGVWKVLFLRYLHPKSNVGQGPQVAAPNVKPKMKVPGEKNKVEIKVKKVEGPPGSVPQAQPEESAEQQNEAAESLEELKKLFGQ